MNLYAVATLSAVALGSWLITRHYQIHPFVQLHWDKEFLNGVWSITLFVKVKRGEASSAQTPSHSGGAIGLLRHFNARVEALRQSWGLAGTEDSSGITMDSGK